MFPEEYEMQTASPGQQNFFENLIPLGFSSRARSHTKEKPDVLNFSQFFSSFQTIDPVRAQYMADFIATKEVGYSKLRHQAQEKKFDVKPVIPDPVSDVLFDAALDVVYLRNRRSLVAPITTSFELVSSSNPGFPYVHCGYPTKGDAVKSPLHTALLKLLATPIPLSCSKQGEALPVEDLAVGKLRTVALTPAYFVSAQKFFFDAQNQGMKLNHPHTWGKYGWVKQYGGFNRLFESLERYASLWELDVSGWDRSVSLLYTYELRLRGLFEYYGISYDGKWALNALFSDDTNPNPRFAASLAKKSPPFSLPLLKWVVFECIFPVQALHNGLVVRRPTGNNSGSNNTTTDNTLAHEIISTHGSLLALQEEDLLTDSALTPSFQGRLSLGQLIDAWFCFCLFGDDNMGGSMLDWSAEKFAQFWIEHYSRYGLVLKQKAVHFLRKPPGSPFSGISFLGSTGVYENGCYVPYPRLGKSLFSLCCVMRSKEDDLDLITAKIEALWDIIAPCQRLSKLRECLVEYARHIRSLLLGSDDHDRYIDRLMFALTDRLNWPLYMGYESNGNFYNFCSPEVGGINSFRMNNHNDIPLGKAPRKTRSLINSMLNTKQLTPEGLKWLIVATDPFHDEPVACDGFPDLTTSSVLTQTVQLTASIARPPSVPSTDNWDCEIFFNPVSPPIAFTVPGVGLPSSDSTLHQIGLTATGLTTIVSARTIYAGLNVLTGAVGVNFMTFPGGIVADPRLSFPQAYASGYFRLIATGFEVVNTTAELYKGGSVTVFKSPTYPQPCTTQATSANPPSCFTTLATMPPGTQSECALFPSSRTWGASDGVYVVPSLNSTEVPFVTPLPTCNAGLVTPADVGTLTTGSGNRLCWLPLSPDGTQTAGMNSPFPFDISGAFFSGLNPNSTLQVTVKYVIERIPSITEPNLLVLTRPPCPFDPMALELYTRIMSMIPVGVKVSDNPDGEFWATILDALSAIAPVVGAAFTPLIGPAGPALGMAASAGLKAGGTAVRQKAQRKAEKKASYASPGNNKPAKKN